MEESDLYGNAPKPISVRIPASLKPTLSGRATSKNSLYFRRLKSRRAPGRQLKGADDGFQWVQGNRVVLWLIVITVWGYVGFHVQSRWAHNDHRREEFVGYKSETDSVNLHGDIENAVASLGSNTTSSYVMEHISVDKAKDSDLKKFSFVSLAQEERHAPSNKTTPKKKRKPPEPRLRKKAMRGETVDGHNRAGETEEGLEPRRNTSHGLLVGPFDKTEDAILGWNADKRRGTCDRKGDFAKVVWSRSFVLVFHELSMTGAPLSMMELATEVLSCGGTVSAVVLIRKGGLMTELEKRGIKVLKDKSEVSFKVAMKADLVIAGSAVCSSWIGQYLLHFPAGSNRIVWWIMENRREYFDRAKNLLNHVKMLTFLSESQSKQWLTWCREEKIHLNTEPMLVPLSVNDELAFVAGIPCSLNTPEFSVEKMLEKRELLRTAVRKEMGLDDNDVLIMALSSINAGKGQRLLLEAALLVDEHKVSLEDFKRGVLLEGKTLPLVPPMNQTAMMDSNQNSMISFHQVSLSNESENVDLTNNISKTASGKQSTRGSRLADMLSRPKKLSTSTGKGENLRNLLTVKEGTKEQNLKVLIGSVGSKSNRAVYIKAILQLLSRHPDLSKLVLWTPATTRVASLYAAADVYVINAQGIGETFGRVTIEAMAFGLPVLGTDAGGTKEIVLDNMTGLLHPIGREGTRTLGKNMLYLLSNPSAREKMGKRGQQRVQDRYLKNHTYQKFAAVLAMCMRTK